MMFDSVLRTEISVDSVIRKSENHAPWSTWKLDSFTNSGVHQGVPFTLKALEFQYIERERGKGKQSYLYPGFASHHFTIIYFIKF